MPSTIGIIGAGKLGIVLAQLAGKAGYRVAISGSGAADTIRLIVETLAPGAVAATNYEVARQSDIIILALPLGKFRQLTPDDFSGKLVIDATNYWWEVDGPRHDILPDSQSSSEAIQEFLPAARVVKALSHMGYHHLHDEARPTGDPARKAIAIAGDYPDDIAIVAKLVDTLGFDPLPIGDLAAGQRLEPGSDAFGADVDIATLRQLLGITS